jgi:O-antigen/teichoic acid export membrane protein
MMQTVTGNVAANLISRAWSMAVQFLAIPFIVHFLGAKAYGLVSLYATLVATLVFLDQGWGSVILREFPRLSATNDSAGAQEMRDLLRSIETASFSAGAILGIVVLCLAPLIVRNWINTEGLSESEAINAVRLMGLCLACQWTNGIYTNGYIALHRQPTLAKITVIQAAISAGGTVLILWLFEPRIELVFLWQAPIWALTNFTLRQQLLKRLPAAPRPAKFRLHLLSAVKRYAFAVVIVGAATAMLTQFDKLIITRYASLDSFAGYSLSFTIASLTTILVASPVGSVLMPLLARLFATRNEKGMAEEYHRWTQVTMFLVLPLSVGLMFFSKPFLEIWLGRSSPLGNIVMTFLPIVAIGTILNAAVTPPSFLQLAAGWTRLLVLKSWLSLPLYIGLLAYSIPKFGPVAGAWCWIILNLAYYLIEVPLVHRRLLKSELFAWWIIDTLLPTIVVMALFRLSTYLVPLSPVPWRGILQGVCTAALSWLVLLAMLPYPRALVQEFGARLLRRLRPR